MFHYFGSTLEPSVCIWRTVGLPDLRQRRSQRPHRKAQLLEVGGFKMARPILCKNLPRDELELGTGRLGTTELWPGIGTTNRMCTLRLEAQLLKLSKQVISPPTLKPLPFPDFLKSSEETRKESSTVLAEIRASPQSKCVLHIRSPACRRKS
jgi:hypothetical protein